MTNLDPIPARLAALKTTSTPDLKQQWRELFDTEPPPFNRRYLESRLAYRIQELAYGGLKPETVKRLEAWANNLTAATSDEAPYPRRSRPSHHRHAADARVAGRRTDSSPSPPDGFEWQGRPYKSLSAIARAITGTRWNGWVFFGLKNHRRAA